MKQHPHFSSKPLAVVVLCALAAVGGAASCHKGPFKAAGSCDLRSADGTEQSELCMELDDHNIDKAKATCVAQGHAWSSSACDTRGALGGCQEDGSILWTFPSSKDKTVEDAKKRCTGAGKFLDGSPAPTPSGASSASVASKPGAQTPSFTSLAGGYSVTFAFGAPTEEVKADTKGVSWNSASSTIGAYSVQYADFATPALAQAAVNGFLSTMKSEIEEDKEVTVSGSKAHELRMHVSATATMWIRMFVVGKRVYKVAAGTKNDVPKAMGFLDSFQLTAPSSGGGNPTTPPPQVLPAQPPKAPQATPKTPQATPKAPQATPKPPQATPPHDLFE